jgi:hypothetical protein
MQIYEAGTALETTSGATTNKFPAFYCTGMLIAAFTKAFTLIILSNL